MVVNISEVNPRFMGHITLKLLSRLLIRVVESDDSVNVIPAQTVDEGLDWGERSLV